eukprot:TRINITY_DN36322_c0_g2_i1.p1 TRINITY_DN36322_c0_g2~~TRINITY_DN36322_c0_g2_i1.p1  ORF type:complete len:510 (-),score=118.68 TRINITY_DN36322_c0_g2_i1:106-1635(-)
MVIRGRRPARSLVVDRFRRGVLALPRNGLVAVAMTASLLLLRRCAVGFAGGAQESCRFARLRGCRLREFASSSTRRSAGGAWSGKGVEDMLRGSSQQPPDSYASKGGAAPSPPGSSLGAFPVADASTAARGSPAGTAEPAAGGAAGDVGEQPTGAAGTAGVADSAGAGSAAPGVAGGPAGAAAGPAVDITELKTPEAVVKKLAELAGPDAGEPPPEIIGTALRSAGIPATAENAARALQAVADLGLGPAPTMEAIAAAVAAANPMSAAAMASAAASGAAAPGLAGGMPAAAPAGMAGMGGAPGATFGTAGSQLTPEDVMRSLLAAAGPGAGTPPVEVIQQALTSMGVAATEENLQRALKFCAEPQPAESQMQMQLTPEDVMRSLMAAVGPGADTPPPVDVLQQALPTMGVPATPENIQRALQYYAQNRAGGAGAVAAGAAPGAISVSTPEEAMQALLKAAPEDAGVPPPEVVGQALRATGIPATASNVMRALKVAAGEGAPEPSTEDSA